MRRRILLRIADAWIWVRAKLWRAWNWRLLRRGVPERWRHDALRRHAR